MERNIFCFNCRKTIELIAFISLKMLVLAAILVILVTFFIWSRRDLYKLSWDLPGPFALPLIGNALEMHPNSECDLKKCANLFLKE